jgi:hypothetical protein
VESCTASPTTPIALASTSKKLITTTR